VKSKRSPFSAHSRIRYLFNETSILKVGDVEAFSSEEELPRLLHDSLELFLSFFLSVPGSYNLKL
jgi:hypothetical protein